MSKSIELSQAVSIHPYFRVQAGKLDAFRDIITEFLARTTTEEHCFFYDFTLCDDVIFCREAYRGAAGVLAHLENVNSCIEAALNVSELIRLEIHGPKSELDQLRGPLADLDAKFFEHIGH